MKASPDVQKDASQSTASLDSGFESQSGTNSQPAPEFAIRSSSTAGGQGTQTTSLDVVATIPKAEGGSPEASNGGQSVTILPGFEFNPGEAFAQYDSVAGTVNYTSRIQNAGSPSGSEFGVTVPSQDVRDIRVTQTTGAFQVAFTYEMRMDWSVVSSGPNGQANITSETDAALTAANYLTAVSDLTPNMGDLNGRPPRTRFWNRALTERHERFHADDAVALGRPAATAAQSWLSTQNASTNSDCQTLVTQAAARIWRGMMTGMAAPGREQRAYGDGAPAYRTLATAIQTRGAGGHYS